MPSWLASNPARPCDRCKRPRVMYTLTAHFRWKKFHKENVTKSLSKLTEDKGIALPMARNNIIAFLRPCTRRPRHILSCTPPCISRSTQCPALLNISIRISVQLFKTVLSSCVFRSHGSCHRQQPRLHDLFLMATSAETLELLVVGVGPCAFAICQYVVLKGTADPIEFKRPFPGLAPPRPTRRESSS